MLPAEVQSEVRDSIVKAQEKYKSQYDKNKFSNMHYDKGDIVFVKEMLLRQVSQRNYNHYLAVRWLLFKNNLAVLIKYYFRTRVMIEDFQQPCM